MSILDTFFIVFKSDTAELEKGMAGVKDQTEKTNKTLSETDPILHKVKDTMGELVSVFGGAIVAGMGVAKMMDGIKGAADYADDIGKFSKEIGANVQDVAAWGDAVKVNGGSAEAFRETLKHLTHEFSSLQMTGMSGMMPTFYRMGISMFDAEGHARKVTDLLPLLAQRMEKMSNMRAMNFGKKLGLDTGTIMLLQQGREAVEKQVNQMRVLDGINKESVDSARKFHAETDKMNIAFRGLWMEVGNEVLPILTWLNDKFIEIVMFMRDHKDFMFGLFMALGSAIAIYAIPPMLSLAASTLVAMAPMLIMIGIVSAIGLAFAAVYDDVMNFLDGNNSMIGEISKKYPIVGELVRSIAKDVKDLWKIIKEIFSDMAEFILHPIKSLEKLEAKLLDVKKKISDTISGAMQIIEHPYDSAKNAISAEKQKIEHAMSFGATSNTVKQAMATVASANSNPLNNTTSNAITNNAISNATGASNKVHIDNIQIATQATDADGISKSIGDTLKDHIHTAISNYNDGIQI